MLIKCHIRLTHCPRRSTSLVVGLPYYTRFTTRLFVFRLDNSLSDDELSNYQYAPNYRPSPTSTKLHRDSIRMQP